MESIRVALPDGSEQVVEKGATPLSVAESIGPRLAKSALVAKLDGQLVDLTAPIEQDTELRILTDRDPEALEVYRHSSAHLLAAAVLELYPETKLGIGPPTEQGFFYDFQRDTPFTPDDLEEIEARMREIVKRDPSRAVAYRAVDPGRDDAYCGRRDPPQQVASTASPAPGRTPQKPTRARRGRRPARCSADPPGD